MSSEAEFFDVLIIGAGISGIGCAYHLQKQLPGKTFVILEKKEHFGGTWWSHQYPGVRSDSDLYTFGFSFKPWKGVPIAAGEEIMKYLGEVISENNLQSTIRYQQEVLGCNFSTAEHRWEVNAQDVRTSTPIKYSATFLFMCPGYYNHETPFTPTWPGMSEFKGRIVHPQQWPKDLDLTEKRVVVIGSGSTAATLIPAIAPTASHVTMLQRSPTWLSPGRNHAELAEELRKLEVDENWIHEIMRKKSIYEAKNFIKMTFDQPEAVRELFLTGLKAYLGEDSENIKHFLPSYRPWQQRIAVVPNGDLFLAVRSGKASVVTDTIDRFTNDGILTATSKEELKADVIVTATGFYLSFMGSIPFSVDGKPFKWSDTITYRGMMFTGVPNLIAIFGYFRYAWTLRVDLVAEFVCRLLKHMDEHNYQQVVPALRSEEDKDIELGPWIDTENFNPNYFFRGEGIQSFPQRGKNKDEWQHTQDYPKDAIDFPKIDVNDSIFQFN